MNNNNKTSEFDELQENLNRIDLLTKRLVLSLANKNNDSDYTKPNQELYYKAASKYFSEMLSNPSRLIENQVKFYKSTLQIWSDAQKDFLNQTENKADVSDRRFKESTWENNPYFKMIKNQYITSSNIIEETVNSIEGLSKPDKKQISFFTKQMVDFFSPTNFLGTNPEAIKEAIDTKGKSLVDGLENLVNDLEKNDGELNVSLTDDDAFEVGKNIAQSKGSVIFQNELFQLIHYEPLSKKCYSVPLLIIPPWINKFYILDLKRENSFIQFCLKKNLSVFVISWVNPGTEHKNVSFEDYIDNGLLKASDIVKRYCKQDQINTIGYCIGGTLLASTLAYLSKKNIKFIKSSTFFTTLTDFEDPGDLSIFVTDEYLSSINKQIEKYGYMEGSFLAKTFSFLRSNDLVYGPAIKSYLMGKKPPPFDLLYWNSDSTNLPGVMALEYLENFYQKNMLSKGKLNVFDEIVSLEDIKLPIFAVATHTDHIAPWKSSFFGLNKTTGEKKFILAGSGHIAGIINPENSVKYGYWTNETKMEDINEWFYKAKKNEGSWWGEWASWIQKKSGSLDEMNFNHNNEFQVIENAPGSYVKKKFK